jgi:hypothetical protein
MTAIKIIVKTVTNAIDSVMSFVIDIGVTVVLKQ